MKTAKLISDRARLRNKFYVTRERPFQKISSQLSNVADPSSFPIQCGSISTNNKIGERIETYKFEISYL